jgi:hypothetical protein
MVPCFVEVTKTLLNIWQELPPEPINLHIYMTKVTLDVIGTSASQNPHCSALARTTPRDGALIETHTDVNAAGYAGISGFGYAFNSLQDSQGLLPTAVSTILLQTEERIFQTASWWKIPFLPSSRRFGIALSLAAAAAASSGH